MKPLGYFTSRRAKKALENPETSMLENLKGILGNHSTNKKFQATALNLANNVTRLGHAPKRILQPENFEYFQRDHTTYWEK